MVTKRHETQIEAHTAGPSRQVPQDGDGALRQSAGTRHAGAGASVVAAEEPGHITIDCDECVMAGTRACDDCVVSYIVNRGTGSCMIMDLDEVRAVRLLAESGLAPQLRYAPDAC